MAGADGGVSAGGVGVVVGGVGDWRGAVPLVQQSPSGDAMPRPDLAE
jgi:hypothetical protein